MHHLPLSPPQSHEETGVYSSFHWAKVGHNTDIQDMYTLYGQFRIPT